MAVCGLAHPTNRGGVQAAQRGGMGVRGAGRRLKRRGVGGMGRARSASMPTATAVSAAAIDRSIRHQSARIDRMVSACHDVLGNVWEWVDDSYGAYDDAPADGRSSYAGDCDYRAVRGGGFYYAPNYLRSAYRRRGDASSRSLHRGFRVARSVR